MFSRSRLLLAFILLGPKINCVLSQEIGASRPAKIATPESRLNAAIPDPAASSVEHWDKLSLRENDLHPDPPIAGQIDAFPEFTRELLRVQWRGGDPIDLYIVRPAGVAKPPVILYLYGYPGEAVRFLDYGFCKAVTKGGFAAVGFSSMLTGQRYHDVPMKEWFVSDLEHSLVGTTHDVQMVLNYLQERHDLDTSRMGVFGEGSGGTIALLAASVDPRIQAVDVLNPWGDWPTWLATSRIVPDAERAGYVTPGFLRPLATLDPVVVLPKLTQRALRLQQSLWDSRYTPAASRDRMAAALPPTAKLNQYKDKQEYLDKVGSNGKMLDWMENALAPIPTRSAAGESHALQNPDSSRATAPMR